MSETGLRSTVRFNKRNQLATAKGRPRQFINTALGNKLLGGDILETLACFLAGRLEVQPDEPPGFLREPVRKLNDPVSLALAALAPLLDQIFRGWDRDDPSAEQALKRKIGDDLYRRLRDSVALPKRWGEKERVQAGHWLLWQALPLDVFHCPEDDFPRMSEKGLEGVAQLRRWMIEADPAYAPLLKPPPPWTSFSKRYDGFPATFVRDWRPETKTAIDSAFLSPDFAHAKGVNALSAVPLKIDPVMLDLVGQFALVGNDGSRSQADQLALTMDLEDAKWCGKRAIWNDHSCDHRGRIYALGHLNFARADHVRSLFRFANGMKLGGDTYWLEIHCANCEGSTDKLPRAERITWVASRREDIEAIAKDPAGTFDKWKGVDSPFAFVAACRELASAWNDPANFVTHLPIGFDGSANGLQHLTLLCGDLHAAIMVNLWPHGGPNDVYALLIAKAVELIGADDCDHASWWRRQFKRLSKKEQRRLLKQPIMTFAYSVTNKGAADQIGEVYRGLPKSEREPRGAFEYLAKRVLEACALELPGPKRVMDYIRAVTEHCTSQGRFLEWTSPSGFPVSNRYQKPNIITVNCLSGSIRVARHNVADGVTNQIKRKKAANSAAPNFVHSLDAAHLIKAVNTAVSQGITDLLTVHDCFYCLAPQATRLHEIILEELADLYENNDPLAELRSRNVIDPDILPVPLTGVVGNPAPSALFMSTLMTTATLEQGQSPVRLWLSPERVKEAKNAFG